MHSAVLHWDAVPSPVKLFVVISAAEKKHISIYEEKLTEMSFLETTESKSCCACLSFWKASHLCVQVSQASFFDLVGYPSANAHFKKHLPKKISRCLVVSL